MISSDGKSTVDRNVSPIAGVLILGDFLLPFADDDRMKIRQEQVATRSTYLDLELESRLPIHPTGVATALQAECLWGPQ